MSKTNRHTLTDGRSLARNTLVNLLGQGAPLLIGLVAIPRLLTAVGVERFGLLSISWLIIGYFSLFDLGLGRAITKLVAEEIGKDHENEIGPIVWTALSLMLIISIVGGLIVAALTPWLTTSVIKIPVALQDESRQAFYLLAFAIPFVTLSAGLRGQLEAFQRFGFVNLIQVFLGILNFLGPLAVAMFTPNMAWIIFVLVVIRIVTCIAFLIGCRDVLSNEARRFQFQKSLVARLLKFGGWLTVSNIISPIMTYCDRFLIGSMLAIGLVAYYTTPYEIVTRLWIVPNAITRVLFPAFSTGAASGEDKTRQLFSQGLRGTFLILFPVIFLIIAFAGEGMTFWLGKEFGTQSAPILRWLAVGVLINSLAWIPFVYIQSAERADLVAKLHVFELPLYLLALWLLVKGFGVEGAAISWVLRLVVDMLALFILAHRIYPGIKSTLLELIPFFITCLLLLGACIFIESVWIRGAFVLVSLGCFSSTAWLRFMAPPEHETVLRMLRLRKSRPLAHQPTIFRAWAIVIDVTSNENPNTTESRAVVEREFERTFFQAASPDVGAQINAIIDQAHREKVDWIAIFNSSSRPSRHYIASFRTFLRSQEDFENIGMLIPTLYNFDATIARQPTANNSQPSTVQSWGWGSLIRCDALHAIGNIPKTFDASVGLTEIWLKLVAFGYVSRCSPETLISMDGNSRIPKRILGIPVALTNLDPKAREKLAATRARLYRAYFWRIPSWVLADTRKSLRDFCKMLIAEVDRGAKMRGLMRGWIRGLSKPSTNS